MTNPDHLSFFGINYEKGASAFPPISVATLAKHARQEKYPKSLQRFFALWSALRHQVGLGLIGGIDPKAIEQTGWGIIYPSNAAPELRKALAPLCDYRRGQAGARYREFWGSDGLHPGESKDEFLARHGVGPGPVDPEKVPYYLLIAADPETIPMSFQYLLDVNYGVGRLHFDNLEDYGHYGETVMASEERAKSRGGTAPRLQLFSVYHDNDPATNGAAHELTRPLRNYFSDAGAVTPQMSYHEGPQATKEVLHHTFMPANTSESTDLLFSVSHGLTFKCGHPNQSKYQGALICGDLINIEDDLRRSHVFAAADLSLNCRTNGMIWFMFNCFGAATPHVTDYDLNATPLCPKANLSALSKRLLALPEGGALAMIGHSDLAKTLSFSWPMAPAQSAVFQSTLYQLLQGYPVGFAMEAFNQRFAELATELIGVYDAVNRGKKTDERKLAQLWAARIDARNYLVVGDPAVRLERTFG